MLESRLILHMDILQFGRWLGDELKLRDKETYTTIKRDGIHLSPGMAVSLIVADSKENAASLGVIRRSKTGEVNYLPPHSDSKVLRPSDMQIFDTVTVPKGARYLFGRLPNCAEDCEKNDYAFCTDKPVSRRHFSVTGAGRIEAIGTYGTFYSNQDYQDTWARPVKVVGRCTNTNEEILRLASTGTRRISLPEIGRKIQLSTYPEIIKRTEKEAARDW